MDNQLLLLISMPMLPVKAKYCIARLLCVLCYVMLCLMLMLMLVKTTWWALVRMQWAQYFLWLGPLLIR